jgi:P4 family phage/plasmid primase-like protien
MIQLVLLREYPKGHERAGKKYHRHPVGYPMGYGVSSVEALFKHIGPILDQLRAKDPENLKNVYYTVASHYGVGGPDPVRDKKSYENQEVLAFDIDYIDTQRAHEYIPVVSKVLGIAPECLTVVFTGNGLHFILQLQTPIRSNKYLEETKPHYNEVVYKINTALKEAGLPGQGDPSIYDAPRILRVPNTINEKNGVSKECRFLQCPQPSVKVDADITKMSGLSDLEILNISPEQLKRNYPRPDFPQVMSNCAFTKWVQDNPDKVHEPQYMRLLGILAAMSPGDKIIYRDKEMTPKDFAHAIFDAATASKSLQGCDFDLKWEHGIRYGAPRCKTVSGDWIGGCEKCPHFGKINTPLALKSQEHISSEENGYWVMGKTGPLRPHYSDVAKIYRRDHSYVACEPDRIMTFEETHYTPTGHLKIKNWLERTVAYEEHLMDAHCTEFVKKVLRSGVISLPQEQDLFEKSIKGKLNCKNGVVDVMNGELVPHAPTMGFKYVLPYDFIPEQTSEFFLEWLSEILQHRPELMEAVLDMMAYCLWPTYDSHVFMYLIGEGRNGKSTLLHIIEALVGEINCASISIYQLGSNRFAPAGLEGKLVNLSEESSGNNLSAEELNIVKALSAGGTIRVENKGEKQFDLKNFTKLIFSANKPPRFHEQGRALRERLIVIPFDHTFENPDANVEKRLLSEVPKIMSMLVKRIQENVASNEGKFRVSKGGSAAQEAQDKLLLAGNSVVEWGLETVESTPDTPEEKYIGCKDAYQHYSRWCQENNYKPVNSVTFGNTMLGVVLKGKVFCSKVMRVGAKTIRIYPRTQWKEEVVQ